VGGMGSGAPAADPRDPHPDQRRDAVEQRRRRVLRVLAAQACGRRAGLRLAFWVGNHDDAGAAVDTDPPQPPPVVLVVIDQHAHPRRVSQVRHPSKHSLALGLAVDRRPQVGTDSGKHDRNNVRRAVGSERRETRDGPTIEELLKGCVREPHRPASIRPMAELRIASLLPSMTEIACALGFLPNLVGRSHECDFPSEVAQLPVCTAPKCSLEGSSREIDERVRSLVAEGLSVYRVDAELLRALAPDVVLTQDQCAVCAASLQDVEAALCAWLDARPRLVSLAPATLADVIGDVVRVADALGAPERGRGLRSLLEGRIARIAERSAGSRRPTVACIEWTDPLMAAGNWLPELVARAGGESLFGEAGKHSRFMDWEELRAADPEVIVALPCGFDLARTRREMKPLVAQSGWRELSAVRAGRVYLTDGNAYFNRPGPRMAESLEILAEILHPELFAFGYAGRAFERWA